MWNEKKMRKMKVLGKMFCFLLFVGFLFLLSGNGRVSVSGEEEVQETEEEAETKGELIAEKKSEVAEIKDSGKILIGAKRLSASKVKITWKKPGGNFIYYVYQKNEKGKDKLLKKVKGNSYTVKGLNQKKKYKFFIELYYAWKGQQDEKSAGKNIYMGKSLPLTIITGGTHFMNVAKIHAKRGGVTLYKKQMHSVRCRLWIKGGGVIYGRPKLHYYSTDSSVAAVDGSGCITAKGKGTAVVFVMAPNGVYDKVSVTVK